MISNKYFNRLTGWSVLMLALAGSAYAQDVPVTITMDEVPTQPANGLTVKGVTFTVVGGNAIFNAPNGGNLTYVQDPALTGDSTAVLTLSFAQPVNNLQLGVARNTFAPLTPGLQVNLFDGTGNQIGGSNLVNTLPLITFSEGLFSISSGVAIKTAVLRFPNAAAANAFAIDNVTFSTFSPYQVNYVSNLAVGDSFIDITNAGTRAAGLPSGTTAATTGALCANIYAFTPDEQMVSCCSCPVTPNGLVSLSAVNDLASNTLTPAVPTALVIKVLASLPIAGSCTNSASSVTATTLVPGLLAWGTKIHAAPAVGTFGVTETRFRNATLSTGELTRLASLCNFIVANGSGFGVCRSCRLGGLGSTRQ